MRLHYGLAIFYISTTAAAVVGGGGGAEKLEASESPISPTSNNGVHVVEIDGKVKVPRSLAGMLAVVEETTLEMTAPITAKVTDPTSTTTNSVLPGSSRPAPTKTSSFQPVWITSIAAYPGNTYTVTNWASQVTTVTNPRRTYTNEYQTVPWLSSWIWTTSGVNHSITSVWTVYPPPQSWPMTPRGDSEERVTSIITAEVIVPTSLQIPGLAARKASENPCQLTSGCGDAYTTVTIVWPDSIWTWPWGSVTTQTASTQIETWYSNGDFPLAGHVTQVLAVAALQEDIEFTPRTTTTTILTTVDLTTTITTTIHSSKNSPNSPSTTLLSATVTQPDAIQSTMLGNLSYDGPLVRFQTAVPNLDTSRKNSTLDRNSTAITPASGVTGHGYTLARTNRTISADKSSSIPHTLITSIATVTPPPVQTSSFSPLSGTPYSPSASSTINLDSGTPKSVHPEEIQGVFRMSMAMAVLALVAALFL